MKTPPEVFDYDVAATESAAPLRTTIEPEREVECGCGRKTRAFITTTTFADNPSEPHRWIRLPPDWFAWAGADLRAPDGARIDGPLVRCPDCMSRQIPPPLREPPV